MYANRLVLGALLGLATAADIGSASATLSAQDLYTPSGQVGARIWLNDSTDYLRRGDRLDVRFSVPTDAYVAVVHIDSEGAVDFLFPASPNHSHLVRGGRTHSLTGLGYPGRIVRGGAGIGYLYVIASPYPLDFGYFRSRAGGGWDWGYAGRSVHGDPFLAFQQISRLIVPAWPSAVYAQDYFGYYVEGIHRYPTFACSDRYYNSGWGWSPSYSSCASHDYFLRQNPYYYDTRRYAGDRRVFLRQYERLDPVHGFKEYPGSVARGVPSRTVPDARASGFGSGSTPTRTVPTSTVPPARQPETRPAPGATREPVTQVGTGSAPDRQAQPAASGRARPAPATGGGTPAAGGSSGSSSTNRAVGRGSSTPPPSTGGSSAAPSTNRAVGRGSSTPAASPAPARGRP